MKPLKIVIALLVGLLAVAGGFVTAQQVDEDGKQMPSDQVTTFDDEAIEQEAKRLTSEEKLEVGQDRIKSMRKTLSQTNELLSKAREEQADILKINCINEKLAAIKGFMKVSEQSYTNLRDATDRNDEQAEIHHYTLIAIANQKVNELGEEAQTCVGDVQLFADETVVERREDPDIADIDPIVADDDLFDDGFATETLPELTPFQ